MEKRVLMRVDLPRPDSPALQHESRSTDAASCYVPTTMAVNWKPLRTLFLWTWLGRLAKPTKPMSFFRMTGERPCSGPGCWREGEEPFARLGESDASPLVVGAG